MSFRDRLRAGEAVYGLSIMIPSPQIVEMTARMGFDWVLIDCEHGAIGADQVELLAMAAQAHAITPIARPATADPVTVGHLMDRGVAGVQIPHVQTPSQARSVVEAVKFAPEGNRSLAVGTRAGQYGLGLGAAEFVQKANEDTVVIVQIEDEQGLAHLPEIAAVDGVDVVFIGPSDLSQALGYPGQHTAPIVQKAMHDAFAAIGRSGKASGCAGNGERTKWYQEQGATYLYTHLNTLLGQAAEAYFQAAKAPHVEP